jgi:hypothetical protein
VIQTAVGIERQISKAATVSLTYLNSRGVHQFVLLDLNPVNAATGLRPTPTLGDVFQYTSAAIYKQNQLIANFRVSMGSKLSLFGFYSLNYANSNTNGASSVPMFSNDLAEDYGRSTFDVRHRMFVGGSIGLPYAFTLNPFVIVTSGTPYNLYTGIDQNGDSVLTNDRPGFATAQTPGAVYVPNLGQYFTLTPTAANLVPVNYFTSPTQFTFNLRVSRTWGFGKKQETTAGNRPPGGGGGGRRGGPPGGGLGPAGLSSAGGNRPPGMGSSVNRRYTLTLSASARNLFNHVNPGIPLADLSVPQAVGTFTTLAGGPFSSYQGANRRIDLQLRFGF